MKKLILAAAITSLFSTGAMANLEEETFDYKGWRVEGGSAELDYPDYDIGKRKGYVVAGGYDINKNIGVSARYSSLDNDQSDWFANSTFTVETIGLYADFGYAFVPDKNFIIKPYLITGLEVITFTGEHESHDGYYSETIESDETAYAYGVGVRFTVMQHLSLSTEFKRSTVNADYSFDTDTVTVMAGYRF